jgi:hypothetical protein
MKKSPLRPAYLSPKVSVLPVSVEKVFVASVQEGATHEEYESVDLFD